MPAQPQRARAGNARRRYARAFSLPKGNVVVACQGAEPEARYAATHALEPGGRRVVAIELRDRLLALQRRREAAAQPAETRRPYDDRRTTPPATSPPVVVADAGWPRIRAALEARRGRQTLRDALTVLLDVTERADAETVAQFDAMMRRLPYSSALAMGPGRNGLLAYGWATRQRSPFFANEQALATCTQRGAQCVLVMSSGSLQEGAFETVARQLGSRDPAAVREAALRAFRQTISSGYAAALRRRRASRGHRLAEADRPAGLPVGLERSAGACGNSSTTVEPSRKRPISSPLASVDRVLGRRRSAIRAPAGTRGGVDHAVPDRRHAADDGRADQRQHEGAERRDSNTQTTRSLRANRPGTPRAVVGLTENSVARHVDHARQRAVARHVDAVVVLRAQVERREAAVVEVRGERCVAADQRRRRVAVALGLQDLVVLDRRRTG